MNITSIQSLLGDEAENLLTYQCQHINRDQIEQPTGTLHKEVFSQSDRSPAVLKNLQRLYHHGRLKGTGYLSILPVDQAIEHTAAYSFYHNPIYFDPENIVKLAIEGGCNGVASTLGVLGLTCGKYGSKIPYIVKVNHNELLTYPTKHEQHMFAQVHQAYNMGAVGVGATIYFGSPDSNRQIEEVSWAFARAHELGMFTILWCYPRNSFWQKPDMNYESAFDVTAQAIHLGVSIEADIIKQKFPNHLAAFSDLDFAKYDREMYQKLASPHPIDLVRYQVAHAYLGKISLLNSGGESGHNDLRDAVRTAVINKRGGGAGLILGRKAFQKPFEEGIELLQAVQDVYLCPEIDLA
ncbi:MAG TPA: class I fructose-bisphosphate aldolase [Candidatus Woesebacteria bacterium]|nr:class I fructose-bisphosphate aldolase [Candidatus Woesebacteria bacterium]